MEIKHVPALELKPTVERVCIELSEMEAGYLRSLLYRHPNCGANGFCRDLFERLDQFNYPNYERKYPVWRERAKARWHSGDDNEGI